MIRFISMPSIGNQPFIRAIVAFEVAEDGRVYYAIETFSSEFVKDVITKYGRSRMATFRRNIKASLAESVTRRERSVDSEYARISTPLEPTRTYEEMRRILELPPE